MRRQFFGPEASTAWNRDRLESELGAAYRDRDACLHSLFGASKVAADVLVQEYGRYFEIPTAVFRGGTLTGPALQWAHRLGQDPRRLWKRYLGLNPLLLLLMILQELRLWRPETAATKPRERLRYG